jgi:hypothetical protein
MSFWKEMYVSINWQIIQPEYHCKIKTFKKNNYILGQFKQGQFEIKKSELIS